MLPKIRYRLVYNYANRTRQDGTAPVALECRQGVRKMYITSNVMLHEDQWSRGQVINHDNAGKLTAYLVKWRNGVEEIELNSLLKNRQMSLSQLKVSVKNGIHESANLRDFTTAVVSNSSRSESTKRGYTYLMNDIEKSYGRITLEDVTYDWILRWRKEMQQTNLSENTVKGRMKMLHAIIEEAMKRGLLNDNPFKWIKIGNMTPHREYLTMAEIRRMENVVCQTPREEKVKDLFLLSVWTGLRYSDLTTLEEATIEKGLLRKRMYKTKIDVTVPIATLFWGKGMDIINKYKNIRDLSHCCKCNSTANRIIKELAKRAGIKKPVHFHLARKSTSTNLSLMGMPLSEISTILGHTRTETTNTYYINGKERSMMKASKRLFRQKVDK